MPALHAIGTKVGYFRKPIGSRIYTGEVINVTEEAYEIRPDHKDGLHTVVLADLVSGSVHLWKAVELS